jgi:hypothetical protein
LQHAPKRTSGEDQRHQREQDRTRECPDVDDGIVDAQHVNRPAAQREDADGEYRRHARGQPSPIAAETDVGEDCAQADTE